MELRVRGDQVLELMGMTAQPWLFQKSLNHTTSSGLVLWYQYLIPIKLLFKTKQNKTKNSIPSGHWFESQLLQLLTQLPASEPGKATADGPAAWVPEWGAGQPRAVRVSGAWRSYLPKYKAFQEHFLPSFFSPQSPWGRTKGENQHMNSHLFELLQQN